MKISELKERTPSMIEQLTTVWESSVRAMHHFLMEEEISQIRQYVPQALAAVERLVVTGTTRTFPSPSWASKERRWRCFLSRRKAGGRESKRSFFPMRWMSFISKSSQSMRKIPRPPDFMSTWVYMPRDVRKRTNKAIIIPSCS